MTLTPDSPWPTRRLVILLACCAALGACDRHAAKSGTQVAAKVGSYEITTYQVNNAVARIPNVPADQLPTARAKVLEGLVTQQLAISQAQQEKLDRQPDVVAALDDARRDILARAYFDQVAQSQPKATDADVEQYYIAHTELFSSRRLYAMKEITLAPNEEALKYAREFATTGKPIEQYSQWLQQKGIRFNASSATRAPEALPLDFLPTLAQTKDGGIVVMRTDSGIYVAQIVTSRAAPISQVDAAASIRRYIENQRSKEALERELGRLRTQAKIEYVGEFANNPALAASPPVAPVALPVTASASASGAATGGTQAPDAGVMQRGVGGVK